MRVHPLHRPLRPGLPGFFGDEGYFYFSRFDRLFIPFHPRGQLGLSIFLKARPMGLLRNRGGHQRLVDFIHSGCGDLDSAPGPAQGLGLADRGT